MIVRRAPILLVAVLLVPVMAAGCFVGVKQEGCDWLAGQRWTQAGLHDVALASSPQHPWEKTVLPDTKSRVTFGFRSSEEALELDVWEDDDVSFTVRAAYKLTNENVASLLNQSFADIGLGNPALRVWDFDPGRPSCYASSFE